MPIIYDKDKQGWSLQNPSEAELGALERIAIEYITSAMGKMAAIAFARLVEEGVTPTAESMKEYAEKMH